MHALAVAAIALTGLHGTVVKGPITPVCRAGEPCSAPAQVTLVFRRTVVGPKANRYRFYWIRTSSTGRYRVSLPAGYYTVTVQEGIGIGRGLQPERVHVRAGHFDRIDFRIDTGLR
ncbi:MAG TPA: hypothetical protein VFA24_00455 [Gaiellaceae bacterium]|nr:hypothetical protein [Gaiellaceae bacterium]